MRAIVFIWSLAGMVVGIMGSCRAPAQYRNDYFVTFCICAVISAVIGYNINRTERDAENKSTKE